MMRNFEFPAVLPPQIDEIRKYEAVGASSEFFDAVIDRIENMLISSRQKGNILLNTAIKFINSSIYDQAMPILEKEILNNPSNDKLYFYMAVCKLGGRRPFVLVKSEIDKIENNISTALALSEKAIYYYFLAYIKFDYHSNKFLKASPDYRQLLTMALNQGITNEETDFLFSLLKTQKPSGF